MKTILITGARGFIGKSTLRYLNTTDLKIIGIYNKTSQSELGKVADIEWIQSDLFDLEQQKMLFEKYKPEYLLHLAWSVPTGEFWHSLDNIKWLNLSIELFKNFCRNGGRYFIGAGSIAEYDWRCPELKEDGTSYQPYSLYGQCKRSLYEILKQLQRKYFSHVSIIWPHIGYFFGVDEPVNKFLSMLISKIKHKEPMYLLNQNTVRDYAHVRYLGKTLAYLIMNSKNDLLLNVSANNQLTLKSIVDFISQYYNVDTSNILYDKYQSPIYEPKSLKICTKRMEKIMGNKFEDTFFIDLKEMMI